MKLGEFIKNFSHNNVIRLVFKNEGGHEVVLDNWNDVSMDWQVNKQQGIFRHYIDNEVLGLTNISFTSVGVNHPEAINIVIEKLDNQPFLEEIVETNVDAYCEN